MIALDNPRKTGLVSQYVSADLQGTNIMSHAVGQAWSFNALKQYVQYVHINELYIGFRNTS